MSARVVDLDTGEELGKDQQGELLISGPNVMKGYLKRDDLTAEVIQNGAYVTGDLAKIDDDGLGIEPCLSNARSRVIDGARL